MKLRDFLFSKQAPMRYYRHIAFWLLRYLFIAQMIGCSMYFFRNIKLLKSINIALTLSLYSVVAEIIFTYLIVYWLIPKFFAFNKKIFIAILLVLSSLLIIAESPVYIQWFKLEELPTYSFVLIWECIIIITSMSHVICGLFIACRLFKNYYLKMEERETLISENARAEMQLLKAQVHPHFLFNTLNNIYSFARKKSPDAGDLVLKLSDTLKYMFNDCEAALVPLEKELKLIQDYIGLERVRYGDRLNMEVELKGEYQHTLLAPLLLIPFVENCFKHGASKILEHPWIKLKIMVEETTLDMYLSNNKPWQALPQKGKNGIGLKNVQERLKLLYPGQHELTINSTANEFSIHLILPIKAEPIKSIPGLNTKPDETLFQNLSYAK